MNINGFDNNTGHDENVGYNLSNIIDNKQLDKQLKKNNEQLIEEVPTLLFEFTQSLVENVKTRRKALGLTQEELSKISKVNRTTIAKLENYQRFVMNVNVIIKLLDSLDLKLNITEK